MRVYTDEQIDFLRENVKGRPIPELVETFNKRFGLQKSYSQITARLKYYKFYNGLDTKFKHGHKHPLANKFKQGNKPPNTAPLGTESVDYLGYVRVKVSDSGARLRRWRRKQEVIWETANGKIPKGGIIIFGDSDKRNFNLDNLILITRGEKAALDTYHLRGASADLTRAGIALVNLKMKIRERQQSGGGESEQTDRKSVQVISK